MRPNDRLTRRSMARALDRTGSSGVALVDDLLAAATADPSGTGSGRENDLVALFRATRPANAPAAARASVVQIARARTAAAKVAVAATAAVLLAGSGVAFAASTGNLPEVLGGDHRSDTGEKHSSAAPGQATNAPRPTGGPTAPVGTPDPAYKGLCTAFQKGATSNPGKAAENPAFSALATEAGGRANIADYCVALIGAPGSNPTGGPTSAPTNGAADPTHPTHPVHPTQAANPTKAPKTPNPNKPTAKPTQTPNPNKPTAKPTKTPNANKPTAKPTKAPQG